MKVEMLERLLDIDSLVCKEWPLDLKCPIDQNGQLFGIRFENISVYDAVRRPQIKA